MTGLQLRLPPAGVLLGALLAVAVTLVLGFVGPSAASAGPSKVTICHIPPGNPENAQTIETGPPALYAHLAHGDIVGPCEPGDEDDSPDDVAEPEPPPEDTGEGEEAAAPLGPNTGDGPCAHLFEEGSPAPGFYVLATGNLDGDADYAFFYRAAGVTPDCRIVGPPVVLDENALE